MSVNSRLKTTQVKGKHSIGREFQSLALKGKKAKEQGKGQQSCISAFLTYPTISSRNQSMESKSSLKQQHEQNFSKEGKPRQIKNNCIRIKKTRKSRIARVRDRDLSRKVDHLNQVKNHKNHSRIHKSLSSNRIGEPVVMIDIQVSKAKHIIIWVD